MIPKIVHYTGPTSKQHWHPLWEVCLDSWFKQFTKDEYEHRFWNDEQLDDLIKNEYPEYWSFYISLPYHIQRIDFAEYAILHKYGGIYHDLDYYCYKNFYDMVKDHSCVLLESVSPNEFVQNSMMASLPGEEYWVYLMDKIINEYYTNPIDSYGNELIDRSFYILDTVGSYVLTRACLRYEKSLTILPKTIFNPCIDEYYDECVTKHMFTGTWGKEFINSVITVSNESNSSFKNYMKIHYKGFRGIDVDNFDFYERNK